MRKFNLLLLSLLLSFSVMAAPKKGAIVQVNLNPAGSFQIKAKIKGSLSKKGSMLTAKKLTASVKSFKTGMDLRDEHTKKKLNYKKFPKILVTDVKAKAGNGVAKITIMNKAQVVKFKYKDIDSKYATAKFQLSLKKFGISGINYMGVGVEDIITVTATLKKK
ncbi:YceI family protein [Bacteriovorax sp. DB6_IX]|uniref:YceI family protein n=1 Tax=Bacteriovorax sp. DB6_IX TaxID=1353530 RepID=UPI000389DD2F|nr:YceI family protein [Bacteriovorax sp. DB6_IX]EQC50400.1 YceI-like domain protein [Bacteriovorax sp. DB6_IX]